MPKLLIHEGAQQSVFELFDDEASIGRGAANVIQVTDNHASKHHGAIRKIAGRFKLVDFESKNGTRINGEFRNQRWLEHGDVITIGDLSITYDGSDVATSPAPHPVTSGSSASVASAPTVRSGAGRSGGARPGGARAGSRRGRDGDEEDEDGERPGRRGRNDNSKALALLVGAGVVGLIAILFLLLSKSGAGQNASALQEAKRIARTGDTRAAVDYLQRYGDPSRRDEYRSVQEQIDTWKSQIEHEQDEVKDKAVRAELKKFHNDFVEQHKNGFSDEDLGKRLIKISEEYQGTLPVMELLNSANQPWPKFRALMEKAKAAAAPK